MSFQLIYTTEVLGDCTRCYNVYMSEPYTIEKFVKEVVSRIHDFGVIDVVNTHDRTLATIDYRYGKASEIPDFLQNMLIQFAYGNGGYSCYGYTLVVDA